MACLTLHKEQSSYALIPHFMSSDVKWLLRCYTHVNTFLPEFPVTNRLARLRDKHFDLLCLGYGAYLTHRNAMAIKPLEICHADFIFEDYHQFLCEKVSGNGGISQFRTYINVCFGTYFGELIEFSAFVMDESEDQDFDLQGLRDCINSVASYIPLQVSVAVEWTTDRIIDGIKKRFQEVVANWCPMAMQACSWLANIWDKVKEWVEEAIKTMTWFLEGARELFYYGVAILTASCAIGIVEKILVATGMIGANCGLVQAFLSSAVLTGGLLSYTKKGQFTDATTMVSLVSVMAGVIASTVSALFGAPAVVAFQGPVELLEGAAAALSVFCDTTLLSMGKTCQAVNQINTCAGNLKAIVGKIFTMLQDFVWKIFGMESRFLRDASLMFEEDVDQWLKDIAACEDAYLEKAYASQDDIMKMQCLIKKGHDMRSKVLKVTSKISPVLASTVTRGVEAIEKLLRTSLCQGIRSSRKIPFVVYAYGASRTGKTLVVDKLISDFQEHFGLGKNTVYNRNPIDQYWSGYRRQPIVNIDDFGAVACDPSMEAQMIPLVSSSPMPLTMAAVEEKGLMFDSKFIFCSSNLLEASPESKVHDNQAFRNRRHVLIHVTLEEGKEYNMHDFTANQRYQILKYDKGTYVVQNEFTSYGDLLTFCLTKWEEHEAEQTANLDQKLEEPELVGDFRSFEVMFSSMILKNVEGKLIKYKDDAAGTEFYDFVSFRRKDKLWHYKINSKGKAYMFSEKVSSDELSSVELESQDILRRCYEMLRFNEDTNLIIKMHLKDLAREDFYDDKMRFIGKFGNEHIQAQMQPTLDNMIDWHKIVLCGMGALQDRTSTVKWYEGLVDKIKDAMYTVYSKEISEWPLGLKIVTGVLLSSLMGAGLWSLMSVLQGAGNTAALGVAAATGFSKYSKEDIAAAQSRKPNRYDVAQYKYRNVPITKRAWAQGTMPLEHATAMIFDKIKASMQYGRTEVQIAIVPGRRFIGYTHFFRNIKTPIRVKINTATGSRHLFYKPENMKYFDDSELCVYEDNTLEDLPDTSWDLFCWDFEKVQQTTFKALFLSCKRKAATGLPNPEWADIDVRTKTESLMINEGDYARVLPRFLEYTAPTVNYDCGSLIVAEIEGTYKVVGIHVAGSGGTKGYACFLPPLVKKAQAQHAQQYFEFLPFEEREGDGIAKIAYLKKGVHIPLPTKTSLVETPPELHLDTPCDKYPSILSNDDPRLLVSGVTDYDPFKAGILKYQNPMGELDQDLLQEVCDEIEETWRDCQEEFETFEEVSLEEAINGIKGMEYMERIPMATSEGFPHILTRSHGEKGKIRFVEGDGEDLTLIPNTSVTEALNVMEENLEHEVPTLIGIECPKDEKLPYRKIFEKPKTRCFSILPMEYNLLVRRRFLKFVRFIMRRRDVLPCQVGINPYGMEWTDLAARLKSKGNNILCCDYSSFDGLLSKQVMAAMAGMINSFCGGDRSIKKKRENLLMACCSRYAICKSTVWRVECGIPSGFPLTVICNSIFNEILIRYSYKAILREQKVPGLISVSFNKHVSMVTYGDDNLLSVSEVIKPFFDGKRLKEFLAKYKVVITDGKDKTSPYLLFRKLEDCDFLKRGFKKDRNGIFWNSPEEKESLWAQLHYINVTNLEQQEAYKTNLVNVLRELYMWDVKECVDLRRKALQRVDWLLPDDLPTIAQIEQWYASCRGRYMPDSSDSINFLLDQEHLGPLLAPQKEQRGVRLTDQVRTANLAHENHTAKKQGELWILCQTLYPHSTLPEGVKAINWPLGNGRGGLPTTAWVEENIKRPTSELRKMVSTALKKGDQIVFATRDNILPCNVLAILFLVLEGHITVETSNTIISAIMQQCKTLGYLVRECDFAFFAT
uniref:RNA1 polyprotein n=1 Tax=Turnip ringspot virus TaxID=392504 RepID=A0A8F1NJZ4_9SECO|nr:polyprotein [Turnip ringspot virus]